MNFSFFNSFQIPRVNKLMLQGLAILCLLFINSKVIRSQTTLPINEEWETRSLTSEDLIIPSSASSVSVYIKGGDGGRIKLNGRICNDVLGGEGASVSATFDVGNEDNMLRPGGRLRVFVGQVGSYDEHGCLAGGLYSGGGGGSSAVLYLPPGTNPSSSSEWHLLAVAGGGGGANRPSSGIRYIGKGGNDIDEGDNVQSGLNGGGQLLGIGRCANGASSGFETGYPGGDTFCEGSESQAGKSISSGYVSYKTGTSDIESVTLKLHDLSEASNTGGTGGKANGGDGFTGGAAGAGGGGGGGGSSGGASGIRTPGGGGGSWLTQGFQISESAKSSGGDGASGNNNGIAQITANLVPKAVCKSEFIVSLDANGVGQLKPSDADDGSVVEPSGKLQLINKSTAAILPNPSSYDCSDVGTDFTVSLQVLDANDELQDECISTIKIRDTRPPTFNCPRSTSIKLDADGTFTLTPDLAAPSVRDNCGVGEITVDKSDFNCSDHGKFYIVNVRVSDIWGNTVTCSRTIWIIDDTPPVPDVSSLPDITAGCSVTVTTVPTATDACAGTIQGTTSDPLTYTQIGTYTINWSFDDGKGNIATQKQKVIITEVTSPVPDVSSLPDIIADCSATITTIPTASNNCGETIQGTTNDPLIYDEQGTYTITWSYNDGKGNTILQTQKVIIEDKTPPVANCVSSFVVNLDENGQASIPENRLDNGSFDNCGGELSFDTDKTTLTCSDDNSIITTIIKDARGNQSTCTALVKIQDDIPPSGSCKNISVELDQSGQVTVAAASLITDTHDNYFECDDRIFAYFEVNGRRTIEYNTTTFNCSNLGINTLTVYFSDFSNNENSCTATVTVEDNLAPIPDAEALANITSECSAALTDLPTATDNCGGTIQGTTNDPLTYNTQGTHTIIWTFDDGNGNVATQNQTIIIKDVSKPIPDVETLPTLEMECAASILAPTATDNCKGTISGTTNDLTSFSEQGTYTINWSYNDGNGNIETQTQTVIIKDVSKPVPDLEELPTIEMECSASVSAPTATDNCAGTVIGTTNDPTSFSEQGTYTITWTFDDGNGNSATQTQTVIVNDVSKPVPDVTNLPTITGECSATISDIPTATDNCAGSTITATTNDPLTYHEQGTYIITWTYNDGNGNIETQTQTVIVNDVSKPVPDVTNLPTITGECSATISDIPSATDNCTGSTITATTNDPLTYTEQGTFTVTWSYDDGNGNIETQTQTVIVDDVTKPVPDVQTLPTITGECSASVAEAPTATDNCAGTITGTTSDPLSYSSQGTHIITWTFDDGHGNVATQTQTVIVNDVSRPVPDQPLLPIINGECSVTVTTAPTATDNCGGTITATTTDPLTYTVHGVYTIRWTFDDGNGNVIVQRQYVTVFDDTPPVPDVASLPTITGECSAVIGSPPTATDNCGGTIIGQMESPPSFFGTDTETITWIYDDGHGNITKQTQTLIVRDVSPPVPDQTSLPELRISCLEEIGENPPTATDACTGQVTGRLLGTVFFPSPGRYTITWTFRDGKGNRSTQEQVVIYGVEDNSFQCKDITISLDDKGEASISPQMVYDGYISDCIPVMLTLDRYDFDCTNLGDNTVTLTRVNLNGANASCTATVTVEGESNCNAGSPSNPWSFPWPGWSSLSTQQSATTQASKMQLQAFPNPFNDQLTVEFVVVQKGQLSIEVFNLQGQRVNSLFQGQVEEGEQMRQQWDGTDQSGRQLPSGMYLIRMQAGDEVVNKRVLLQR